MSSITNPSTGAIAPQLTAYQYDQLNRVKQIKAYRDLNTTTNAWGNGSTQDNSYKTTVSYDANGNITEMIRNGLSPTLNMDNLKYYYWNKGKTAS